MFGFRNNTLCVKFFVLRFAVVSTIEHCVILLFKTHHVRVVLFGMFFSWLFAYEIIGQLKSGYFLYRALFLVSLATAEYIYNVSG